VIVSLIVAFIFRYEIWKLANYEWHACSNRLAHTFLSLGYDYHVSVNMGERTKNYDRGPMSISQILQNIYAIILPQTLLFIGLLVLGFVVNWRMMLVIIGFFPLIGIVSVLVGKKVHVKQKEANAFWDKTLGRFTDSLQNIAIIKLFSRGKQEEVIIRDMNTQAIDTQLKINVLWGILDVGSGFIDFLARTVVMIVGVIFIMSHLMTLGELFLFVTLAGRIFAPLNAIE
jgi:ATP-binding cassette subfamily B protein